MSGIEKAKLTAVGEPKATAIPVQFNPNTLSLSMQNSIDGSKNKGRQTRKYTGTSSATLSFDLEFDTADEGTDVRLRTKEVAQFVLPVGKKSKKAPPQVKFEWGDFMLQGVMSSLSEELTFFSSDGTPLRAKLSVEIKEQDPKYAANESGPGSDPADPAPASGGGGANPAAPGAGDAANAAAAAADRASEALADETPADFLARNGLAPEAWRALGSALDALEDGVSLPVGLAIPFPSSLSLGAGIGITAGFAAGVDLSAEASLGLSVGVGGATGDRRTDQGITLSASGGLTAASETQQQAQADKAAADARMRFGTTTDGAGAGPAPSTPRPGGADRSPISTNTGPATTPTLAPPLAPPTPADRRATTYGHGVPLRERIQVPGSERCGWVVLGERDPTDTTVSVGRSRTAPWESLPTDAGRRRADTEQHHRSPDCGCHRCDPRSRLRFAR